MRPLFIPILIIPVWLILRNNRQETPIDGYIPEAPDYYDARMWIMRDGDPDRPIRIAGFSQGALAAIR